jgi:hypothetical protein
MTESITVRTEQLPPVGTRISWGAILAGAMVALALYFLLTLLGAALGLSVGGQVRPEDIGSGAAVWAIAAMLLALFVGGYVTSQCTVGESKGESVMYGVVVWGVLFAILLWLTATGVRSGFHAMVGLTSAADAVARDTPSDDWEAAAHRAGVPQETVAEWKRQNTNLTEAGRGAAADPQNQERLKAATRVTWWALLGTLLSMFASVGGALLGAGSPVRLLWATAPRAALDPREPAGFRPSSASGGGGRVGGLPIAESERV